MKVMSMKAPQRRAANDCGTDGSGQPPRIDVPLTSRSLLRGSGVLMGTLAAGGALTGLAPSRAWALELKTLCSSEGAALMKMGRVLYPHAKLPDAVYALVAKDLDASACDDPARALLIRDGCSQLDKAAGGNFAKATAARQLQVLKSMEGKSFVKAVRSQCLTSLYDNDMAVAAIGDRPAAWEQGGDITRGFHDLKWLPDPLKEANEASSHEASMG
jgi:hypothetical protein